MNREQFLEYVDHFNNKRYDKVTSYFAPDITVEYFTNFLDPLAPARTLRGPKEFIESYAALHDYAREAMELGVFISQGDLMFVELYTEFHWFKDHPADARPAIFAKEPPKKGHVAVMTNWVLYNMEGEKMKRIRIAHFRMHDPKSARL
jgi:hypothetical protein